MAKIRALVPLLTLLWSWSASAEVNYSLHAGLRSWEGDNAGFESNSGISLQHQFDFGPGAWDWRPELGFGWANEVLDDRGESEFSIGIARRWRTDDTELRLSLGGLWGEAHDSNRRADVTGAYFQAGLIWHVGARFGLGTSARWGEIEDTVVAGNNLPNDFRQLTLALHWRFGN